MEKAPREDLQSMMFASWLEYQKGVKFTHIPNETWTPSMKQKIRNQHMGVKRGLPDFIVLIDSKAEKTGRDLQIWIEMKRDVTCKATPNQQEWIDWLRKIDDVDALVADGFDHAVKIISAHLRHPILPN